VAQQQSIPNSAHLKDHPLIATKNIVKQYPGTLALDHVSVEIWRGEVVGLVGENGAGKSTLLKILAGAVRPDDGVLQVFGEDTQFHSVRDAARCGVGLVSQEQSTLPNLTVAENVALGSEDLVTPGLLYRWGRVRAWAKRWLSHVGSTLPTEKKVNALHFQERQLVELAKAMSVRERTSDNSALLLDEPTTVLDRDQVVALFDIIRQIKVNTAVVFVSHRLEEVLEIADRVYVMRDGQVVGERAASECSPDELFRLMVGDKSASKKPKLTRTTTTANGANPALKISAFAGRGFRNVNLQVFPGQILGIAGVNDSGKESLCRTLFGAEAATSGEVYVAGKRISVKTPTQAVAAGIGYLPADRRIESAAVNLSVRANMTLTHLTQFSRWGFIMPGKERQQTDEWSSRLRIKAPHLDVAMGTLSGGNQQKALIARWLIEGQLHVLILDHPFRGLDLGAKREVHDLILQVAADGIAIVLLTDSLEELIELSDRILVMKDGDVRQEIDVTPDYPAPVDIVAAMV
jgi:ribose transport system ATP-binding protein